MPVTAADIPQELLGHIIDFLGAEASSRVSGASNEVYNLQGAQRDLLGCSLVYLD